MHAIKRTPVFVQRGARAISTKRRVTVGLRREDPARTWERRTPLTPDGVEELVGDLGAEVLVEECERRVYRTRDYEKAGARIVPAGKHALEPADVILGIKEVPLEECITSRADRTHLMFSHTAKGQPYNTPLLARFVGNEDRANLVDYELLTDGETGKRVVAFGWYAGAAGLVEGLITSAHSELQLGVASPFLYLPRPYTHPSLDDMRASLRRVGKHIASTGTSPALGPFVVAVTGNGNVAQGALEMLKELPVVYVKPKDLPAFVSSTQTDLHKIYVVHLPPSAYIRGRANDEPYEREAYYKGPSAWKSVFADEIAPYTSLLINGAGWKHGFPRLVSNDDLPRVVAKAKQVGPGRFGSIADVSCDFEGGLEFVTHPTSICAPIYTHALGPHLMTIEILPAELPKDASKHFAKALEPFLHALVRQKGGKGREKDGRLLDALDRAMIVERGVLRPKHAWLMDRIEAHFAQERKGESGGKESSVAAGVESKALDATAAPSQVVGGSAASKPVGTPATSSVSQGPPGKKRILLLGSGMVARPAVEVFLGREDVQLVVASNNLSEARALVQSHPNAEVVLLDVSDRGRVAELVSGADVVVSLLPATLHVPIAEECIKHRRHLVTASYISDAMKALHERAVSADVLLLNEIGLDPGIDHCGAMEMRDRFEKEGKKIVSFVSWCGGLPAPEDSNVPLGMKFSWTPKGLLSAALNSARFKLADEIVQIPGEDLLKSHFPDVPLAKGFSLEGLANRDSLGYAEMYRLGDVHGMKSLFRGTLRYVEIDYMRAFFGFLKVERRYKGFADTLYAFRQLGLLQNGDQDKIMIDSWHELVARAASKAIKDEIKATDIKEVVPQLVAPERAETVIPALQWIGAMPNGSTNAYGSGLPAVPRGPVTPLDALATLLSHKLRYEPHERDLVLLSHEVITAPISSPTSDPTTTEIYTSTLAVYGSSSRGSAMSRTVGLPLAFAALCVLDGGVRARGVAGPFGEEVYRPVLRGLEEVGLGMRETRVVGGEGMARGLMRGMRRI
ncbi:hypothetical protein FRC10_004790 [Ceratobasidium sp. 414]|nr:hypothetical protein FRC10_004790 [Ceratobasidium sp. 414]